MAREKSAPTPKALVASARRLKLTGTQPRRRRSSSQEAARAWRYYDTVSEVWFLNNVRANAAARCIYYVAQDDQHDPDGEPERVEDDEVQAIWDRVADQIGGQAEVFRLLELGISVPGECYIVGLNIGQEPQSEEEPVAGRPVGEHWTILPPRAVKTGNDGTLVLLDEGVWVKTNEQTDIVVRVWQSHPEAPWRADTELRPLFDVFDEYLMIDQSIRTLARSRLARDGILEVSKALGRGDPSAESNADGTDTPAYLAEMVAHFNAPFADETSAASLVPYMIEVEQDELGKTFHLTEFPRPVDEMMLKRAEAIFLRIIRGLDAPPEIIQGIADMNHWNSWALDENSFKNHWAPRIDARCELLTAVVLRPLLKSAGVTGWETMRVWRDPRRLIQRPNRQQDATKGVELGALSLATWRRDHGYTDDDAPDENEKAERLALSRGPMTPEMTVALLTLAGTLLQPIPVAPTPVEALPPGDEPDGEDPERGPPDDEEPDASEDAPAVTSAAAPRRDAVGRRLSAIDRELRTRLHAAAEAAMRRGLERAGTRLRSKAVAAGGTTRTAVKNVPAHLVHSTLGRPAVQTLGLAEDEALEDAFADLAHDFDRWTDAATRDALTLLHADLNEQQREEFAERRQSAWTWLAAALFALGTRRLYAPDPEVPEQGEHEDGQLVPIGLVRQALTRAGNRTVEPERPLLGLAVGELVLEAGDAEVESYVWEYGAFPRRPFPPHEALAGVEFEAFESDVLANTEGWPSVTYLYPGDHDGCACGYSVILKSDTAPTDGGIPLAASGQETT